MTVRVRFSPSPSGDLHVGSVHTALFNWLFARHEGGAFVLRIEDTDPATAKPELIEPIMEGLRWLGLSWDEGPDVGGPFAPYLDSQRGERHREAAERLLAEGHAYRCWCTRDDIKARGIDTGYDGHCRRLTDAERAARAGEPSAVRFAWPEDRAEVLVPDLIMGEVRSEDVQDRVIVRSDGSPLYVLANAVDDIDMDITHVIRGADLLSTTPVQVLVWEALGATPPVFAHVPLILGPDRAKLSKRHGATGILQFRSDGILSEALVNYLSLLGWSSPSQEEQLTVDRIVDEFTLDRVHQAPSIFDHEKLRWLNQQHIQGLDPDDLERRIGELHPDLPSDTVHAVIELGLIQTRITTLAELPDAIRYLHERPAVPDSKWLGTEEADGTLEAVAASLELVEPWTADVIRELIQGVIAERGLHRRKGPKPIFVAIAGSEVALPLFESIWLLGREESVERLRMAIGRSHP